MTQFSSGKHEKIVADPEPWALRAPGVFGVRGKRDGGHDADMGWEWLRAPRPEFNRPLTNPANPILTEFREGFDGDLRGWHMWLVLAREEMLSDGRCALEHYDHAHAVLSRLAILGGES